MILFLLALESGPGDFFAFALFVRAGSVEVVDTQICGTNEDRGIGNKADAAADTGYFQAGLAEYPVAHYACGLAKGFRRMRSDKSRNGQSKSGLEEFPAR